MLQFDVACPQLNYSCFQKGVIRCKSLLYGKSGNLHDFLIFHKIVVYIRIHLFENSHNVSFRWDSLILSHCFFKIMKILLVYRSFSKSSFKFMPQMFDRIKVWELGRPIWNHAQIHSIHEFFPFKSGAVNEKKAKIGVGKIEALFICFNCKIRTCILTQ